MSYGLKTQAGAVLGPFEYVQRDGETWVTPEMVIPASVTGETAEVIDWVPPDIQVSKTRDQLKAERDAAVFAIKVTTKAGHTFDGNEEAQGRMARAILAMTDSDTLPWVLADNTVAFVERAELQEALRLASLAMAEIWVRPYQ